MDINLMESKPFVEGSYLVCSILFILSLAGLSSPESSKRGNWFGITAMFLSILSTLFNEDFEKDYASFIIAISAGGLIGTIMAVRVWMISMPQLVAALHSFVGLAATLVSFSNFFKLEGDLSAVEIIETAVGVFIGSVTFTGSIVAWGKLQEWIRSSPLILCGPVRHLLNLLILFISLALSVYIGIGTDFYFKLYCLIGISLLAAFLGWHLVMAIGGADMPVVVSMLNSYSGWATAASGFLLQNWLLIVTGALVGSSGAILSYIMCKAMNRSFISVIAGGFGQSVHKDAIETTENKVPESINLENTIQLLRKADSIVIVPGYGMAVARCQYILADLTNLLIKSGKKIKYCIHPVAGRLPGHMNVLLAEADVDYKIVKEMDEVNGQFSSTDLVLVIGANDTVNPDAIDNPSSIIAGMPVCKVWEAKNVIVFKRGASGQGYSKAENPLFIKPNARMFYGNAFDSLSKINSEIKNEKFEFGNSKAIELDEQAVEETIESQLNDLPNSIMTIGVPKEIVHLEKRVAVTPSIVPKFRKLGFRLLVEDGAGQGANFSNQVYVNYGAEIVSNAEVWKSDVILKVRKIEHEEEDKLSHVKLLVSYVTPSMHTEWLKGLAERYPGLTYLAMDQVPRISRAQKLDSLSSMANVAGYRAVMEAFQFFQKCPKPMITAAGKLPPAQVLVIGAGVAGLAAIGYSKNLGCIVKAMDTRSAAREDAESMGAQFLEVSIKEEGATAGGYSKSMSEEYLQAQYQLTKSAAKVADIIITTALIPGRRAPILVDSDVVHVMKPGSVIVDMAAEMGGNCSLTHKDQVIVTENGVTIIGYTDLNSRMSPQSSELYANNLLNLISDIGGAYKYKINPEDEIIGSMMVVHEGKMSWYTKPFVPVPAPHSILKTTIVHKPANANSFYSQIDFLVISSLLVIVFIGISYALGTDTQADELRNLIMIFVMAVFIGYMVIWNVTPSLHTPLMSVTNAISGIIEIGAMLLIGPFTDEYSYAQDALALLSVFFASINIFGGFTVTYRMLQMFKTKDRS